jgi:hypothetical protein
VAAPGPGVVGRGAAAAAPCGVRVLVLPWLDFGQDIAPGAASYAGMQKPMATLHTVLFREEAGSTAYTECLMRAGSTVSHFPLLDTESSDTTDLIQVSGACAGPAAADTRNAPGQGAHGRFCATPICRLSVMCVRAAAPRLSSRVRAPHGSWWRCSGPAPVTASMAALARLMAALPLQYPYSAWARVPQTFCSAAGSPAWLRPRLTTPRRSCQRWWRTLTHCTPALTDRSCSCAGTNGWRPSRPRCGRLGAEFERCRYTARALPRKTCFQHGSWLPLLALQPPLGRNTREPVPAAAAHRARQTSRFAWCGSVPPV